MAKDVLSDRQMKLLCDAERLDSYENTGCGYFLSVKHPSLPAEPRTLSEPAVVGKFGDIQAGFVVFLGYGELTLECHTWGPVDVPEDFREREVVIITPSVNFVDLRGAT
jgi:hypothetical protein